MTDYAALLPFCADGQRKIVQAVIDNGTVGQAAKSLNKNKRYLFRALAVVKKKAALQGYSPEHNMTRTVPDGFTVKGVSTYYNRDGEPSGQWVKSSADNERRLELMREWAESLSADVPALPKIPAAKDHDKDLLSVYPMGDPHFGMYSMAQESGDDFNLEECSRLTRSAIDRLVSRSPNSERGLLLNLGDFFHADDSSNSTPASKNPLDVDGRYHNIMQVGEDALVYCIRRLLEKHKTVDVWCMPGNHDPHMSLALSMILSAHFRDNKRVTIDKSPSLYKYMRFGKVLIGSHHGHGAKPADLPLLMANDRAQDWGMSEYRYWYCGHIHHKTMKESPGVIVETFRTLAPRDAWHAGKGYRAGRDMNLIVHHCEFGEILRARCDVAMIRGDT